MSDYFMYVCPECKKIFKVQGSNKRVKCTKCAVFLADTKIAFEDWGTLSADEKENAKQKASTPATPVVTPAEPQILKEPEKTITCPQCGTEIKHGSKFCNECGYNFITQKAPESAPVQTPPPAPAPIPAPAPTPIVQPVVVPVVVPPQPQSTSLFAGYEDKVNSTPINKQVNLMKCPSCGADIDMKSKQCTFCGAYITSDMRKEREMVTKEGCPKCGSSNITFNREKQGEYKGKNGTSIVRSTVGFCKDCGHTWTPSTPPKKKDHTALWVLGWICIFPLPLTILLLRKKELKPLIKYGSIVLAWLVYLVIGLSGNSDKKNAVKETPVVKEEATVQDTAAEEAEEEPVETPAVEEKAADTSISAGGLAEKYSVTLAPSSKDMKVGDIGEKSGIFVGLSYVKAMTYLPTALGKEDISGNNEVIIGFFDFLNATGDKTSISPGDITCYVDGTQVEDVDTYINVVVDEVDQFYSASVDTDMKMLSCQDFEVPKGWNEIKFFYKSDCVWTVTPDDVSTEPFNKDSMYTFTAEHEETAPDTIIYSEDYELQYKGFAEHTYNNVISGEEKYAVFEFTLNNTSDKQIDYDLAGYNMRAYRNGYLLEDPTFTLDDKIDGFSNIFNIDNIESGMSSNIYLAFEVPDFSGDYFFVYDDGYIMDKNKGSVSVKN